MQPTCSPVRQHRDVDDAAGERAIRAYGIFISLVMGATSSLAVLAVWEFIRHV